MSVRVAAALAFSLTLCVAAASAQEVRLAGLGGKVKTLTASQLAALPHVELTVTVEGKTATYRGVPLAALLARVDAPLGKALRGPELRDVVLVTAKDGDAAVLALAEVDPMERKDAVLLADAVDGHPIGEGQGPFRLVVPGDQRGARLVRMVTGVELRRVGPET
jgi:DMSO/TMAO reductase YedYZ molybdopterin-dependent catalytic subunit